MNWLGAFTAASGLLLVFFIDKGADISRRSANIGYTLWIMSLNYFFWMFATIADFFISAKPVPRILEAFNSKMLVCFIAGNVMTGILNLSFDLSTISAENGFLLIGLYLLVVSAIAMRS